LKSLKRSPTQGIKKWPQRLITKHRVKIKILKERLIRHEQARLWGVREKGRPCNLEETQAAYHSSIRALQLLEHPQTTPQVPDMLARRADDHHDVPARILPGTTGDMILAPPQLPLTTTTANMVLSSTPRLPARLPSIIAYANSLRILEEERLQKEKEDAEEAARQKEASMNHQGKFSWRNWSLNTTANLATPQLPSPFFKIACPREITHCHRGQ
jgi:hypothetical protein